MTDSPTTPRSPAPGGPGHEAAAAALPPALPPAIARLFRHALAEGRVHPLMPWLLRYRQRRNDGTAP